MCINCNGITLFKGDTGIGITSIVWTSNSNSQPQGTEGTTDTYTITLSDSTTSTFLITNGNNGTNGVYGGWSSEWQFDNNTGSGSGSQEFRFNTATLVSVTNLYINYINNDSTNISQFLAAWSNSGNYGLIRISKKDDPNIFWMGELTSLTDNTTEYICGVNTVVTNGTFNDTDEFIISFVKNGSRGPSGGSEILYTNMTEYQSGDADITYDVNTSLMNTDGDTIIIDHLLTAVFTSPGNYTFTNSGGNPGTSQVLVTHTYDVTENTNVYVKTTLVKKGLNLVGHCRLSGNPDGLTVYKFTCTNFFGDVTSQFILQSNNAEGDSTIDDVIIKFIPKQ